MNSENITLSEISQSRKDSYYIFHLYEVCSKVKFIKTESIIVVTRDQSETGTGSYCLMGTKFLFEMMKKFWKLTVVMVAQHWERT